MVEFAIVLPVLLLFIVGIIYFGRFEDYSNQSTQLAAQGARAAAVNFNPPGAGTLQAYILSQAQPELQAGSADVTAAKAYLYYPTGSSNLVGSTVRACVRFSMTFPVAVRITGPVAVTQTANMRIEQLQTAASWTPDTAAVALAAGCPTS